MVLFFPLHPLLKIFQIKHSSVFCFLFSDCLNGSDYVWLLGVAGFRILSGSTGSSTRKRIKGDVTWLLECVECKVVRGILVCRRLLLVMGLLVKSPIIIGNLFWKLLKKKFDRKVKQTSLSHISFPHRDLEEIP